MGAFILIGVISVTNIAALMLVLWRVERFLSRTLAYIKAESVFDAEAAIKQSAEDDSPPSPTAEQRMEDLQKQAYDSK